MLQELQQLFQSTVLAPVHDLANTLSGGDPMARGLVVVAILGGLVAAFRKTPGQLWEAFKRKTLVTVVFRNNDENFNQVNLFTIINKFVVDNTSLKSYMVQNPPLTDNSQSLVFGPNNGKYWFFAKGKLFFYTRTAKIGGTADSPNEPETIKLSWFGRAPSELFSFVEMTEGCFLRPKSKRTYLVDDGQQGANQVGTINDKNKIIIAKHVKEKLDAALIRFRDKREWYLEKGLTHKLIIVLHGPPGTGKTSLTRYVADFLNRQITIPSTYCFYNTSFGAFINRSRSFESVISIQDFDGYPGFSNRQLTESKERGSDSTSNRLSLQTTLNVFQGDIPLDQCVVVMTTNHLEKIDPAVYRTGRAELVLEIGLFGYDEVQEFYSVYYETDDVLPNSFKGIQVASSQLMDIFIRNSEDPQAFKEALVEYVPVSAETKKLLETV